MRKILNIIAKSITYIISNVILPIIVVVGFTIFADLAKAAVSSNTELMTVINQVRGNKSLVEIIIEFHHQISLLTVAYISFVLCVDAIEKIKINLIESSEEGSQNCFHKENLNDLFFDFKINHLRI